MRGVIYHISKCEETTFPKGTWEQFMHWFLGLHSYQIDIETNITDWWYDKKLISIQFGSCHGRPTQWFLQWSALTSEQQSWLVYQLNHDKRQKLAHNAKFEYIVLRFFGIILENLFCTMVAEKIIEGGEENKDYSLADISWRYLRIIMNKEEQTNFGDDIITHSKIEYGCTDVKYLDIIKRQQIEECDKLGLLNVLGLEMEALPAFSDITYEGMILDIEKWRANIEIALPIVEKAKETIDAWLKVEPFAAKAIKAGYISDEDRIDINTNSHQQRGAMLKKLIPDIPGGNLPMVRAYVSNNGPSLPLATLDMLVSYLHKDYKPLINTCIRDHRDWCINNGFLLPAGIGTINWNSPVQALEMAILVEPKLQGLSEEEINKTIHPMLQDLVAYRKALKLLSSFGEEFIHKYVDPTGKVRTNFNQILTTGRVSSSGPNLQQIVVGDKIVTEDDPNGVRYRNCFICEPGWKFVDSDYVSQELTIIAYISKDPVWMDCIANGYDLHSVCADLVYKDKWKKGAQPDCAYYKMIVRSDGVLRQAKQKCKCKIHKSLRSSIKPVVFGLAYGMTEYKLAGELRISLREARFLIKEFFNVFPAIAGVLQVLGDFGVDNGYILTLPPFRRRRKFPKWEYYKNMIEPYRLSIIHVTELGEIERASKNHPIQGTSADIVKCAMVLVRNYIRDNDLWDKVKLQAQVHDQITTKAKEDFTEEWKVKLDELMLDAAKLVIPTGILKAETQITDTWTK